MEKKDEKKNNFFRNLAGHFRTVSIHKYYVAEGCFKCGMYRQGILHDMSKFAPVEFFVGVRYFDGHRSPNAVEKQQKGCSEAWLHHKGRNRHHFEYWMDLPFDHSAPVYGCRMPMKYVAEMVCDRRAACRAYHGKNYASADAWEYYARSKDLLIIHPDTRAVLEKALLVMKDEGDDACFTYLRSLLKITRGFDYSRESLGL